MLPVLILCDIVRFDDAKNSPRLINYEKKINSSLYKMTDLEVKTENNLPVKPLEEAPLVILAPAQPDPLVEEMRKQLSLVIDIKHLNAANILAAVTKGMQIAKNIKTKTNEQKKILLLHVLDAMIRDSDLKQDEKDDLSWVVNTMGSSAIELFLAVASKGKSVFKNSRCFICR